MQAITLALAALASGLVLYLPPAQAFAVYMTTLLFYPVYLVVQVGSLDISAGRIVVTVLLLRCLLNPGIRAKFQWCSLDSWVTCFMLVILSIAVTAWKIPIAKTLENEAGRIVDSYFAYMTARLCLTDQNAMRTTIKWIAAALIPLAVLGAVESYTGWAPYYQLRRYCPWASITTPTLNIRSGFYRAVGPFSHPILFGAAFVMFLPVVYWLRHESRRWRLRSRAIIIMLIIGAMSSMSSGPVMMLIFTVFFLWLERHKNYVKPLLVLLATMLVLAEIGSNRTIWHVVASYADPIGGSGWHRAKLLDVAIERFGEWWFVGYRRQDPGWGAAVGMTWTDITNHYLVVGVKYGILGIIMLVGVLIVSVKNLIRMHKAAAPKVSKSWHWSLGTILMALIISFNAFTLFGQANTLFYCLLGFIGSTIALPKCSGVLKEWSIKQLGPNRLDRVASQPTAMLRETFR